MRSRAWSFLMLFGAVAMLPPRAGAQAIFSEDFEWASACRWQTVGGSQVAGTISADITRSPSPAGESALGDVVADALLAASEPFGLGTAVVAFMNPGGIRADLLYAPSGGEASGEVTCPEALAVQPFGDELVAMDLTGLYLDELLEEQFDTPRVGANRFLQVSEGFTYTWDPSAPTGSKVDIASIEIDGAAVQPLSLYRVVVNDFLAAGSDNFPVLALGVNRVQGGLDLGALIAYLGANSPVAPGPQDRISVANP